MYPYIITQGLNRLKSTAFFIWIISMKPLYISFTKPVFSFNIIMVKLGFFYFVVNS